MPLHTKHSVLENLDDELYSSTDLSVSLPKFKFPKTEQDPRHAYRSSARRTDAGRQFAAEPGHILPDLGRT